LYEAGVESFRQLATMTPDEILILLNLPEWRRRGVDPQSWIEQAHTLASQREKVESVP
jgi:predicted flap endonuclease-1-like 5' DNA nuclease